MTSSLSVLATAGPALAAATCTGGTSSDFNGDGISDAAIAEPGADAVHILYGTRSGLTTTSSRAFPIDDQLLTAPNAHDFGGALATGDFNGDGCTDLAVSDPVGSISGSDGVVYLFYGSPTGLSTTGQVVLSSNATGGSTATDGNFGQSLTAGDLNGDGIADLVVGDAGRDAGRGAVYTFPGARTSQPGTFGDMFVEGSRAFPDTAQEDDWFGSALAIGDFNGDGRGDLAVGAPGQNGSGTVFIAKGVNSADPLSGAGQQIWTQDSSGIYGTSEPGDQFGSALATGDFNGDGRIDLAIGVPQDSVGSVSQAGAINVIYSAGTNGLASAGNQLWTENATGLGTSAAAGALLGGNLAAGDFNGDGKTDLAASLVGEPVDGAVSAGAVQVLAGAAAGLSATGSSFWTQDTAGVPGTAQNDDAFGWGLAALNVTAAGRADLVIGVPLETYTGSPSAAGEVEFFHSSTSGLTTTGIQVFDSATSGIKGTPTDLGNFGEVDA